MQNNIEDVAKILGVKLNEVFQIRFYRHKNPYKSVWYKITENGLIYSYVKDKGFLSKSNALEGLILGKHQIIKSI